VAHGSPRGVRNSTLLLYAGAAATVLIVAIALSTCTADLGLAKPSVNVRRIALAVAEVDATLEGDADFLEFSESLYVGLVAHRTLAVRNPADNQVDHALGKALDCYMALRESWQLEREGAWDPAIHGDPAYWRSFHTAVELPAEGPLGTAELHRLLRQEALVHVRDALSIVER
jgi:hypothetical protein